MIPAVSILAIFLCHFLELIGQPGQTLLKFKGSDGKSNGFVLLWMLNVAISLWYSIICPHIPLKMYRSFRPKWGSRLQEWWCFWLILMELCCPNYLHTVSYQDTFHEVIWKNYQKTLFVCFTPSWKSIQICLENLYLLTDER